MGDFLKSARFKILFGVFILLLFFMLRAAWTGGLSPLLSQGTGLLVTPLQKASSSISDAVSGYFQRYVRADELAAENAALQSEVNELRSQLIDYEQYRQENENLRQYIGLKEENPDFELEPASVVKRDSDDRFFSFMIDKGSINGITLYDTVISPEGLVGAITEVGPNFSKVTTILDVRSKVGAYDNRTRDIGIVNGDIELAAEGKCKLTYLPRESGAAKDDLVVTSGGSIYPKNLVIGKVTEIREGEGKISLYAVVEPAADIKNLTDVMVIKSYQGQGEPDE
ncbi:rod shape-determining protein MreC [Marasmitruncus massiliensis]|uniref:rod shape-determining protein MreC n=1 Tax=Marasmitruncus massiliensis TaxID=1944642 RepID=UPI000C7E1F5D|nr:rod shape-determining protein MreC [Marasmitruncus massiliensis]MBE6907562.1 rod shape-determining protein MreC [Oscillospiraceae bacterium]